jgi:hypothetical protein
MIQKEITPSYLFGTQENSFLIGSSSAENQKPRDEGNKKKENEINFGNLILPIILCTSVLALEEAIAFKEGNGTIHSFLDSGTLFKCEGGLYSASQLCLMCISSYFLILNYVFIIFS